MQAGRELDALVAEKIMGLKVGATDWPCGRVPGCGAYEAAIDRDCVNDFDWFTDRGPVTIEVVEADENFVIATPIPFYATDIAAAWTVVEKMRDMAVTIALTEIYPPELWHSWVATFYKQGESPFRENPFPASRRAETAPLAICLAALKACGAEESE